MRAVCYLVSPTLAGACLETEADGDREREGEGSEVKRNRPDKNATELFIRWAHLAVTSLVPKRRSSGTTSTAAGLTDPQQHRRRRRRHPHRRITSDYRIVLAMPRLSLLQ